jgi:hypothetical protein
MIAIAAPPQETDPETSVRHSAEGSGIAPDADGQD